MPSKNRPVLERHRTAQHRQVNDLGSLSKAERSFSRNGISVAGRGRAVLAVCAVYSGPDAFGRVLRHVCGRGGDLEFGDSGSENRRPVRGFYLEHVLSGRTETDIHHERQEVRPRHKHLAPHFSRQMTPNKSYAAGAVSQRRSEVCPAAFRVQHIVVQESDLKAQS